MKREFVKRVVSLALAAGMLLTSALAAEPESVKEFRNGKTKMMSSNQGVSMVLQQDGSLWGWGIAGWGGLGNGGKFDKAQGEDAPGIRTYPEKVMTDVAFIDVGSVTLVIKKDGTLWYTGGVSKQTSLGIQVISREYQLSFVKIADDILNAASGGTSTGEDVIYAVKTNGELWEYKFAYVHDSGSTVVNMDEEPQISTAHYEIMSKKMLEDVVQVSAAMNHALALKADGSVWAWGNQQGGQIGNGTNSGEDGGYHAKAVEETPVKVLDNAKDVYANDLFSAAIKKDGSLWAWGRFPDRHSEVTPVKIADSVKDVAIGSNIGIGILKENGTVWILGNWLGMFSTSKSANLRESSLSGMESICMDSQTIFMQKANGSMWCAGHRGKFGLGPDLVKELDANPYSTATVYAEIPVQLTGLSATSTTPAPTTQTATAEPTTSKILLDGKSVSLDAYNINANNYCKIRDVAKLLNGTGKQFEVTWDKTLQAVSMTSNHAYTTVGGELAKGDGESKTATLNTAKIYLDGKEISLTAYNIGGNNYIKLRDLGQTFDFGVSFDSAVGAVRIDTTKGYTPE